MCDDLVGKYPFQFTHPGRGATMPSPAVAFGRSVSIHAPREGCDASALAFTSSSVGFQFTHPGRGATRATQGLTTDNGFQFTHPGRGATGAFIVVALRPSVSIHAPREGCDHMYIDDLRIFAEFQFTHPGRGATAYRQVYHLGEAVSIHAPREGCDFRAVALNLGSFVSIHAPREGCDL